ncbi:hypothetical protein H4O20_13405 [Aequorivita sp. 609]|uniref:hypothetical protein n=1 Tax=Aequorivita TaxID=153265 RepID=UPI001619EA34|nr:MULTISPECIES: hypothetical protein [Aequorivita]MBB6682441.1 hypothetical protein [Aequorivita sp. 609]
MKQEDWAKMNKETHYNSLIKQDTANRKLIKKLQLERDELKKQLKLYGVVVPKGTLFCGKENKNCEYLKKDNKCGLRKRWCAYQTK